MLCKFFLLAELKTSVDSIYMPIPGMHIQNRRASARRSHLCLCFVSIRPPVEASVLLHVRSRADVLIAVLPYRVSNFFARNTALPRFFFPERLAVADLGRLRELMLREGRLLDTLSHCCIVPLEYGWLEQRAGFDQAKGACATPCRTPLSNTTNTAEDAEETSASAEEGGIGAGLLESGDHQRRYKGGCSEEGRLRQPRMLGTPTVSTTGGAATSCNGVCFPVDSGDGRGENDAATFLLRSWVPLTLEDAGVVDDDDDDDDDVDQDEEGGLAHNTRHPGDDGTRRKKHYGGFEQLRWGGDDTTNWRGTAEPKSMAMANWTTSSTNTVGFDGPLERKPSELAVAADWYCSRAFGGREEASGGGRVGFVSSPGERILSLASYLLLPDWLPLSVWFETEFEPRTTAQGTQDDGATMAAVTAPDDWTLVWRHLLSMFVQVRASPFDEKPCEGVGVICTGNIFTRVFGSGWVRVPLMKRETATSSRICVELLKGCVAPCKVVSDLLTKALQQYSRKWWRMF